MSDTTSNKDGVSFQGVVSATIGESRRVPVRNAELQDKYNEMHAKGTSSWFSDGREERETILRMGEPWDDKIVLEIGCGEGKLTNIIANTGIKQICGIDYSPVAISTAKDRYPMLPFHSSSYRELPASAPWNRIVMQGVLEHLDNPFTELKWMIVNLLVKGGDVITSSPCFLNPRGIVWMTLDMLGAVMSKTDLHYLHPWQFQDFCDAYGYNLVKEECDIDWGNGEDMIHDLFQRIPLALRDGNLIPKQPVAVFLDFLSRFRLRGTGATMVYRITT